MMQTQTKAPDPYGPDVNPYERANRMKKATRIVLHMWNQWKADGRDPEGFGDHVANMDRPEQIQAAEEAGQNPPGESGKTWVVVTDLADRLERRKQSRATKDPFAAFLVD